MIDFYQVEDDLRTMLVAGTYTDTIKEWKIEPMERDLLAGNMPMVCINLPKSDLKLITIPNGYYGTLMFRIMVLAMDFSEFRKAAIVRDRILKEVLLRLQNNRQFSALIATSSMGPSVDFAAGIAAQNDVMKGHIASAEFDLIVEANVDATP